jgi:hypothetical protein
MKSLKPFIQKQSKRGDFWPTRNSWQSLTKENYRFNILRKLQKAYVSTSYKNTTGNVQGSHSHLI